MTNAKTEIGLLCGTKHVVRQRIQLVHEGFCQAAEAPRWTTASFQVDEDPPQRIEIPFQAVAYFRVIGDSNDHAVTPDVVLIDETRRPG